MANHGVLEQGAALRGVRDMFQGKPGEAGPSGQPQALPLELAKQPWMDLPDWELTPQQRAALKEYEQKLQVCASPWSGLSCCRHRRHNKLYYTSNSRP